MVFGQSSLIITHTEVQIGVYCEISVSDGVERTFRPTFLSSNYTEPPVNTCIAQCNHLQFACIVGFGASHGVEGAPVAWRWRGEG